jgi:hypothetical protein
MKPARQLLDELLVMAAPTAGVTITIFERPGSMPNWISTLPGSIPLRALSRYQEACAAFRKTDHQVDWSEIPGAKWGAATFETAEPQGLQAAGVGYTMA